MAKLPTRTSAESLLFQSMKRAASLKQEQDREYEAMVLKTTRLRELRLAKEAAVREAATPTVSPQAYEKPSERKAREKVEAIRRVRKAARKLAQREGLVASPRIKRPTFGRPSIGPSSRFNMREM